MTPYRTTILSTIKLEALGLNIGDSTRIVCPSCGGGSSKEASLRLQCHETGLITYCCFRASCGIRGVLGGSAIPSPSQSKKDAPRPFRGALTAIPDEVASFIEKKYRITDIGDWRWAPDEGRVMIPVKNWRGYRVGWVARGMDVHPYNGPKALLFYDGDKILYHVGNH